MCTNLYFDKTRNLNGYNLKAIMADQSKVISYNATRVGSKKCRGANLVILCTVLRHINATARVKTFQNYGSLDERGPFNQKDLKELVSGTADVSLTSYILDEFWKFEAYPFFDTHCKIVSLKKSSSITDRFIFLFDLKSWLLLSIISFSGIMLLKYILKQSISQATLEFVRMLISVSTLGQPQHSSGKPFLIVCLLMALAMSILIQSLLSAMTTTSDFNFIDTLEDLRHLNMPIYGMPNSLVETFDKTFRERFQTLGHFGECADRLLKGENIICIYGDNVLRYYLYESELIHISKDNIFQAGITYRFAEDSPLLYKINWILSRINEGGFARSFYARDHMYYSRPAGKYDFTMRLNLQNLSSNIIILLGGITLSIFVFLIESSIGMIKNLL